MMTLYHGTDIDSAIAICKEKGIDISKGLPHTDFGQGFYATDDLESAIKWAKRKARVRNKKPAVVSLVFDIESAEPIIEKFSDDLRWGRFVINNRNGIKYITKVPFKENNLDARYHITYGRIADADVLAVSKELEDSGEMLKSLDSILNINYPFQYAFHTEKATEYIKKMSYRSV